jgi:4-carboxymuconolactone decarboxylase
MSRLQMFNERDQTSPNQIETYDYIIGSRGKMLRPFAAMLHRPEIARAAADLGAVIRYQGTLSDADRELIICVIATERDCQYEWDSHLPLALAAGVNESTLNEIRAKAPIAEVDAAELIDGVRELCRTGELSDQSFATLQSRFGDGGVVEVTATAGYYSMIAMILKVSDAC